MNVIFLDVDGVLNGCNPWFQLIIMFWDAFHLPTKIAADFMDIYGVHERKVKRLAKICKLTGAKIVMTSTWRDAVWKNSKMPDVQKLIRLFKKYDIEIFDITKHLTLEDHYMERPEEIKEWIRRHQEVRRFIIIDDEHIRTLEHYQIRTSNYKFDGGAGKWTWEGLRHKNIKEAVNLMKRMEVLEWAKIM